MRTVRDTLRIALLATLLVAALTPLAACRNDGPTVLINADESDTSASVTLRPGDTFAISLRGNPTTGYHWKVLEIDPRVLRVIDEEDFDPDSDAEGAGGRVTLTFEALASGSTTLLLGYQPEYESDPVPQATYEVAVTIREQ